MEATGDLTTRGDEPTPAAGASDGTVEPSALTPEPSSEDPLLPPPHS